MFDVSWEGIHQKVEWKTEPNKQFVEFFQTNYAATPDKRALSFLDLGCGTGAQTIYLADQGCTVLAVDGSSTATKKLRKNVGSNPNVVISTIDYNVGTFPGKSFDCIIDLCSLQHVCLLDAVTLIQRAKLWLKPNGYFFMKMACEPYDLSVSRSDFIRMTHYQDLPILLEGYNSYCHKLEEVLQNGKQVSHLIVQAWLPGSLPPCWHKKPEGAFIGA